MNPANLAAAYRGLFAETPDEAEASLARTLEGLVERAEGATQMRDTALRAIAIAAKLVLIERPHGGPSLDAALDHLAEAVNAERGEK